MDYSKAVQAIILRRKNELTAYELAKRALLESNSDYYALECSIRSKELDVVMQKGKHSDLPTLKQLRTKMEQDAGIVVPTVQCALCNDSGMIKGKPCRCAVRLAINGDDSIKLPLHRLEDSDFSLFGDKSVTMQKHFENLRQAVVKYPLGNKKRMFVLMGSAGTGKTFLAGFVAKEMLENGGSVMALSMFNTNNRFLKYHTTFSEEKTDFLTPLLDCDLLILDDLGTESILKNVTKEYLYQVLNERTFSSKMTFITTNLSPNGILERYGERIYSRIFNKELCYAALFAGKDLRSIL